MGRKRPLGISLIGYFYIFSVFVLILSLFFFDLTANEFGIAARFGLPGVPENIMRVLVSITTLIMIYGYMRLQKWGYWFMMLYSLYFAGVSIYMSMHYHQQPFYGNAIWSLIVLIYTFWKSKSFIHKNSQVV